MNRKFSEEEAGTYHVIHKATISEFSQEDVQHIGDEAGLACPFAGRRAWQVALGHLQHTFQSLLSASESLVLCLISSFQGLIDVTLPQLDVFECDM